MPPKFRKAVPPGESVQRLLGSARLSDATKRGYLGRVRQYLREAQMAPDELVAAARSRPREFEERFIAFIRETGRRSSTSTTTAFRDSVKRFLEINRVEGVNWGYVNEFVPGAKKAGQDRAPTLEEVRRVVDVADLRMKCLVLFLCSSGARIGSVQWLRWKDVEEVEVGGEKFAKLVIYRGEPEEYVTFITPECHRYWQEYRRWRESIGEKVAPSSHVFVTQGNATSFNSGGVRPASVKTLKNLLGRLLDNLGLRSAISERGGYRNYEFKQAHGFRKFFKTRMEVAGVKPLAIETMMGHNTGVSKSYYKPTTEELAKEYSKAIAELTVVKGGKGLDKDAVLATIRREMMGGRYTEEEIREFGDLSRLTVGQFVEILDRKAMGLNGNSAQKVVPLSEVRALVEQGWEYVSQLPDGYTIVRLPKPANGP
jgi:integrase